MPTYAAPKNMLETLFNQMEEKFLLITGLEDMKALTAKQAEAAVEACNRPALERINADLDRLIKIQAEEAARKADEDAAFARFQLVRKAELDVWHACKNAWLRFVRQDPRNTANRQLAFAKGEVSGEACFFMRFARAEDRIHRLWTEGPDYVDQTLIRDLETLRNDAVGFKANFCTEPGCGIQIPMRITPRKGGKAFQPTKCQAHAPSKKVQDDPDKIVTDQIEAIADLNAGSDSGLILINGSAPLSSETFQATVEDTVPAGKPEKKRSPKRVKTVSENGEQRGGRKGRKHDTEADLADRASLD